MVVCYRHPVGWWNIPRVSCLAVFIPLPLARSTKKNKKEGWENLILTIMHLVKENDVYKRERKVEFTLEETVTFKHFSKPELEVYEQREYDWYMSVALEKSDKVTEDRHLLTADLLISYRLAIREGYNHQLDRNLRSRYDEPRNRNTVKGIKGYIAKIEKASEEEIKAWEE